MPAEPLVSILMTAYNREVFIADAINSVQQSAYKNWELIIVDDCSIDNTVAIAEKFAFDDSRIKLFINEKNVGDYPNRNRAGGFANGDYIMFCDSDDKLFPDTIVKILERITLINEFNFAMCWKHSNETFTLSSAAALHKHLFELPFLTIGPGGTFMRRSFFNSIGRYPEKYGPANDMYFNLKAASFTDITLLPFEFVDYRIHEGQEINNSFSYIYNGYNYMRDALNEILLPINPEQKQWLLNKNKRRLLTNIISFFLKTGDIKKTREILSKTGYGFKDAFKAVFH